MTLRVKPGKKLAVLFNMSEAVKFDIVVRLRMPGYGPKVIGGVYQSFDYDDDKGPVIYTAYDNGGNDVGQPTNDWKVVENNFKKYAEKLVKENRHEAWLELSEREEGINKIRREKNKQQKDKQINR